MTGAIAHILKSKLTNLPWIERFGGLVSAATRPIIASGADGVQVVTGYQTYPVAPEVNQANCWEEGRFKHFEPDSTKTAIAFFTDQSGTNFERIEGPKNAQLIMSFDLRFVCWINTERLGSGITAGRPNLTAILVPYVMAQFNGRHDPFGLFNGGYEEEMYQDVTVLRMSELPKNPSMFQPFTFAVDGDKRGLFIYPYDYFGVRVQGTFRINVNCLNDLLLKTTADYCIDGSGVLPDMVPFDAIVLEDNATGITQENNTDIIQQ